MPLDLDGIRDDERSTDADTVLRVAIAQADGYRKEGLDSAEACALAIGNTAFLILREMGYQGDEIRAMADRIRKAS